MIATSTDYTRRIGALLLYIEKQMDGDTDYETILRGVEERLEHIRTDMMDAPRVLKPVVAFVTLPRFALEDGACWAANYYGFTLNKLKTASREARLTLVRHTVMWFMRTRMCASLAAIGKVFGRDHSTVCYAVTRIDRDRATSPEIKDDTDALCAAYTLAREVA